MAIRDSGDDLLAHGVELFNSRYFFEAHELLEDVWLHDRSPSRRFYQGLIQIASAYHHCVNGNYRGALDLFVRGSDLLRPYGKSYLGVDLEDLLARVAQDAEVVRTLRDGAVAGEPVVPPQIRYEPSH